MTDHVQRVYLAGDWMSAPIGLADKIDATGSHIVVPRWWDDKVPRSGNLSLLVHEVSQADVFVLDMRGERFGEHYYAGCHVAMGIAAAKGMPIFVIPGDGEVKVKADGVYTSLASGKKISERALLAHLSSSTK